MKNSSSFTLLLLSVGLFYTFISPHYDKVKMYRSQSAQYKDILANVTMLTEKRQDLEAKYANTPEAEIAKLEKILPPNVDTVTLAMTLDTIAAKYGISIKSVRTTERTSDGTTIVQNAGNKAYQPVLVTFAFTSDYDDFRGFMDDLEKSLRILDVKTLNFTTSDTGEYSFQVEIETYWLKQ
jgi:Tfp pilus assembly protein PilO